MFQAATVLGYTPISTEKASSPQDSWRREGYLVVKKTSSRQIVLKNIANEILKGRQKDLQTIQDKKK
jgi:signal recognition particle subunit SEC65